MRIGTREEPWSRKITNTPSPDCNARLREVESGELGTVEALLWNYLIPSHYVGKGPRVLRALSDLGKIFSCQHTQCNCSQDCRRKEKLNHL